MAARKLAVSGAPELLKMPAERMAVVRTVGDPNVVGERAMQALYGSVYTLKFARKKAGDDFKVGALRARWSGARLEADGSLSGPKDEWRGAWGLPIPDGIEEVPQKVQGTEVRPETWEYGTVAQILHIGPYATEPPTVRRLHDFIAAQGYEIAGEHEEEYLTRPTARVVKTLIRYPVRKRAAR